MNYALLLAMLLALCPLTTSQSSSSSLHETPWAGPSGNEEQEDADPFAGLPGVAGDFEPAPAGDPLWEAAKCKGNNLYHGMAFNEDQAVAYINPIVSPWDGPMTTEMATWGYADDTASPMRQLDCDFANYHRMRRAFEALGADPRVSGYGGPNKCFTILHYNSPAVERQPDGQMPPRDFQYYTVNGRQYRITGASFTIGVNPQSGFVYFVSRANPALAAMRQWRLDSLPPKDQLPALRSSSDIAWGFWNRVSAGNLGNIHKFMSMHIVNRETQSIILRSVARVGISDLNNIPVWPGLSFNSQTEEFYALLGAPNSLGAALFLAQHKRQLGANKYIHTITIFREDATNVMPNLLYWVSNVPPHQRSTAHATVNNIVEFSEPRLLKRNKDWTNFERESVMWVKT